MARRERKFLTLKWLEKHDACQPARQHFESVFGQKATISAVVKELHRKEPLWMGTYIYDRDLWEAWLLTQKPSLTKALVKYGARVNVRGGEALYITIYYRRMRNVLKTLIQCGAEVRPDMITMAENDENHALAKLLTETMNKQLARRKKVTN
ncbi:MAG TPA: hypothetical protein VI978_01835 [Candidatus Paceibacterota bacterium]